MHTLIVDSETANLSIAHLLKQAQNGGVELQDSQGQVVAFVLPPSDRQAWIYAEAAIDLSEHASEIKNALGRAGGVSTADLLRKAADAAKSEPRQ
jgi:hypothetical protein